MIALLRHMKIFGMIPALVCDLILFLGSCGNSPGHRQPAVPVTTEMVRTSSLPLDVQAIGTVEPLATVSVRPQVSGLLLQVDFTEGQDVLAGQVLFRIDARPFQVALRQAEAALERDRIQAANADREEKRYEDLAQKGFATKEQYESLRTSAAAYQSVLAADLATVEKARLDLEYCTIHAPIAGRTGSVLVKAGNLVRPEDPAPLVIINQLDPILVRFAIPEKEFIAIQRNMAQHELQAQAVPDPAGPPHIGSLVFMDNAIDTSTGTILLKARFDNHERQLWPGNFAQVFLRLDTEKDLLVVPSQAVQMSQQGNLVFVIEAGNTVSLRKVGIGRTVNGLTVVIAGLKAGEQVVVDGQLRLTEGAKVEMETAPKTAGAMP